LWGIPYAEFSDKRRKRLYNLEVSIICLRALVPKLGASAPLGALATMKGALAPNWAIEGL